MNERIQKLYQQATIRYSVYETLKPRDERKSIPDIFAELIVQECVGIADDYVKDCTCEEHINCKHPRSAIGRKIREHFGVEE